MNLFELFEKKDKSPSPEELRLKTVLSVLSNRMRQDDFPSKLDWNRLERVLEKSNIPFSQEQVRNFIDDKFSGLSMDDRGTIKIASEPSVDVDDMDMGADDLTTDLAQPDMSAEPSPEDEEMSEPVTDVNVTDKMAKRALKRRIG